MVDIIYRKHGLKFGTVWFCEDARAVMEKTAADIVLFRGIDDTDLHNGVYVPQKTMLTDLTEPPDKMLGRFSSTCRNRIRKAERAGLEFSFYDADALKADTTLMEAFKEDYCEFLRLKGLRAPFNDKAMQLYLDGGHLILTAVSKAGVRYAQHTMVTDGKRTRGLYSVARFRSDGLDAKAMSNANRYLHWKEMEYLWRHGYETYDWGGIEDEKQPDGVDRFKLEFRRRIHEYCNILAGKTVKGKAAGRLLRLCNGWVNEQLGNRRCIEHTVGNI